MSLNHLDHNVLSLQTPAKASWKRIAFRRYCMCQAAVGRKESATIR